MMNRFFLAILLLFSLPVFGEVRTFSRQEIKTLEIKALNVKVVLNHKDLPQTRKKSKPQQVFKIQGDFSSFSFEQEGQKLKILDSRYHAQDFWESPPPKEVIFTITGAGLPLHLYTYKTSVHLNSWKGNVALFSRQASLSGKDTEGFLQLFFKRGELNLENHKGNLSLKGFFVNSYLKNLSEGAFSFQFNEGILKTVESSGHLIFTTGKGKVVVSRMDGIMEGSTQSGSVRASIIPQKIDVSSQEGELRFYLRKTGAFVSAHSELGRVYAPVYMNKEYSGKSLRVTGRMKGASSSANVLLKTNTSNIYVY